MKLICVRHGETEENIKQIIQGHLQGKLTNDGIEQAKRVAKKLKDKKIDHIYSSDLARARDTAKEIAKFHLKTPIKFVEELRERKLGWLEGKQKGVDLLNWEEKRKKYYKPDCRPRGGESYRELYERTKKFLYKILDKHKEDTVLFVSHGGTMKALVGFITNKPIKEIALMKRVDNAGVSVFEVKKDKDHKIHCHNYDKHLIR